MDMDNLTELTRIANLVNAATARFDAQWPDGPETLDANGDFVDLSDWDSAQFDHWEELAGYAEAMAALIVPTTTTKEN